ncbi:MAG: hypothetical protein ACOYY2_00245 [Actinomycetota bacterium]
MTLLAVVVAVEQPRSSINPVLNGVVTFLALAGLLLAVLLWGRGRG